MTKREAVNLITWGLLLAVMGIVVLFVGMVTGFFLFYIIAGAIIALIGLSNLKKKPLIGLAMIAVGAFTILGKTVAPLAMLLKIGGWLSLIGGGILILVGVMKVRS